MFDALKAEIARLEAELGAKWDAVWAEIDRLEHSLPTGGESPPAEPPAPGPVPETPAPVTMIVVGNPQDGAA